MLYLIQVVDWLFLTYSLMIIVRIFSSWIPEFSQYRIIKFVHFYTEPYLGLFRKIIPPFGMIDLSPIVALFCLSLLQKLVIAGIFYLLT